MGSGGGKHHPTMNPFGIFRSVPISPFVKAVAGAVVTLPVLGVLSDLFGCAPIPKPNPATPKCTTQYLYNSHPSCGRGHDGCTAMSRGWILKHRPLTGYRHVDG